ncbi:choline ABC transporter ATP-binding protein [Photobacterium angustum]|uniref:Choline ABC transporter ATP-binding protein n=1 Tax=Photobacterium angustum TaxID=661 RepID=A0A855SGL3_PHOAN|nr:choline ABC transporter ATP-binding protein [Photobacterium angustum]KJF83295.1 ABC transporter ATP-binding protein [Photobacterium damselae subsp. damselae]KJG08125.1 ABC transporter ATP-binding protein [Photobacterium angustum]KJG42855.1 ABC transporter ATP-binding protein [Photobacterium angustum]KJG47603.1 ABC transporter ATP-binding protein [Photobacterium angustum]KJG50153.1 ABC transporter ATP-binding protein [Photobacterium angustum]
MNAITINNLDVVFGDKQQQALALLDQGKSRQQIIDETNQVVGVNNVSLQIKEGEICVLMGLSGSGKSSLLRAVNGLNDISRGELLIKDGEQTVGLANCSKAQLQHLRTHRVSMVFQKFALMPWLTVLDNVAFGLEMQNIPKKERHQRAREQLEMVGLAEWEDKYPSELSGGMQQRVGLARAFVMDTDILLMDEPFSALDPLIRAQLQDELLALQSKLNKTILFVSHDLDEALKIGNNIAIMESGELIQHGKPEEIVLNPKTDYVRDFVAHTNPLNVLKGRSLMTPLTALEQQGNTYKVCDADELWIAQNEDTLTIVNEGNLDCLSWQVTDAIPSHINDTTIVMVSPDISMRDAIELKRLNNKPLLMVENNQLVGVLHNKDVYNALLGDFQLAS